MNCRRTLWFLATAALMVGGGCSRSSELACLKVPEPTSYAIGLPAKDAASARQKAERCIHHEAYRLTSSLGENEAIAMGVIGACLSQVQAAQTRVYLDVTTIALPVPFPPGVVADIPVCRDGKQACKPWERAWSDQASEARRPGSIDNKMVTETAEIMSKRVADDLRLVAFFRVAEARALKCGN